MNVHELTFFLTESHACSYLADQQARTLFVDPKVIPDAELHHTLNRHGFRRSGNHLYRPHCDACRACLSCRIPVQDFGWNRRYRRVQALNRDLRLVITPPSFDPERFALYSRYIEARHPAGDMYPPSVQQYQDFLLSRWCQSQFMEWFEQDRLVAVAVTDELVDGFSAVYTFFDPKLCQRSLGTYAILAQVQRCLELGKPYLYLGYWVKDCGKMRYKGQFRPLEVHSGKGDQWVRLT